MVRKQRCIFTSKATNLHCSRYTGNLKFNSGFGSVELYMVFVHGIFTGIVHPLLGNGNVNSISDDGTGDMTISFSAAIQILIILVVSVDDYGNSEYPN